VLTLLLLVATPPILILLVLMIGDPQSPFVTFLPLLAIFLFNQHIAAELAPAHRQLGVCHWYQLRHRAQFASYCITLLLPALPMLAIGAGMAIHASFTVSTAARLINFITAAAATIFIGCRKITGSSKNESEYLLDLLLFGIITVGNFIPWIGFAFSITAAGVLVLLDGGSLRRLPEPGLEPHR
jgi:hypothetical protein